MRRIYLAGGGGKEDSALLDARFASELDKSKPLVYIPVAMKQERYKDCLNWFESVFAPFGISRIEMWTDLTKITRNPHEISGIYIGGGDTRVLLNKIYESRFDAYLREALSNGIPVYGGSAGAIILGKDIRTAQEAQNKPAASSQGIDVLGGYSIVCHYTPTQDLQQLAKEARHKLIAIPERSGVCIEDKVLEVIGFEPIFIVINEQKIAVEPKQQHAL